MNAPESAPVPPLPDIPPAPAEGKRLVPTTDLCLTCQVRFTRPMLMWHRRNNHRVLPCRICGARVTAFLSRASSPDYWELAHFCSIDCLVVAQQRGLCPKCAVIMQHPADDWGNCARCAAGRRHTGRSIATVNLALRDIKRAQRKISRVG